MHQIDYFVDFCCPYSAKFFKTLHSEVLPYVFESKLPVKFILRHQIQPWHPQSTMTHEAALAVKTLDEGKYLEFCKILFEKQTEFFDKNTYDLSRTQIYQKLVTVAGSQGVDQSKMMDLLIYSKSAGDHLNEGNLVTNALKRE